MLRSSVTVLAKRVVKIVPKRMGAPATNAATGATSVAAAAPVHTPLRMPPLTAEAAPQVSVDSSGSSFPSPPPLFPPTAADGTTSYQVEPRRKVIKRILTKKKRATPPTGSDGSTVGVGGAPRPADTVPVAPLSQGTAPSPSRVERHVTDDAVVDNGEVGALSRDDLDEQEANPGSREFAGDMVSAQLRGFHSSDDGDRRCGDGQKTAMVKAYRIDEVTSFCSPHDAVFARRLPSGGCQFFAWPGTKLSVASHAIATMPDTIRTVHAVFGREKTPIDIVLDIDCHVPPEHWSMSRIGPFQQKVLDDALSVVAEEIEKMGEQIATQVVLQSPNLKKASFHVHTKLRDAVFQDYHSLYGFLSKFQDRIPNVDMQVYRANGMLRMFKCLKENRTSPIIVYDTPKWNIGFPGGKVPDDAAALHSVVVREPGTYKRVLRFDAPRIPFASTSSTDDAAEGMSADENGNQTVKVHRVLMPRTEREAVENASRWLRNATEYEVGEWRSWIGLGLCAYRVGYQFRDAESVRRPPLEEMLEAWAEASRKCPAKYKAGECEARWMSFDPHKLTRGDWWSAYQKLGRLEAATREGIEMAARELHSASRARTSSSSAPSPPPAAQSEPARAADPVPTSGAVAEPRKKLVKRKKKRSA